MSDKKSKVKNISVDDLNSISGGATQADTPKSRFEKPEENIRKTNVSFTNIFPKDQINDILKKYGH